MIEAMACGTPTIAFRHGSVPEIIENGVSGLIVESTEEAVKAVERVKNISRKACRNAFLQRFTVRRMANDYLKLYKQIITNHLPLYERPVAGKSEMEELLTEDAA